MISYYKSIYRKGKIYMKKLFFAGICAMMLLAAGCAPKINVETRDVSGITNNDAVVNGYISEYEEMPTYVGIYFGTSEDEMEKIIRDSTPGGLYLASDIDVDYDITIDSGEVLEPNTTYYYQFFARVDGKDVKGEIKSFTTLESIPEANVSVETEKEIRDLTADNAKLFVRISDFEVKPDEAGLYFGKSPDDLVKVARRKNPMSLYDYPSFEIWFDINADVHIALEPETTYYYQHYAKIGDTEKRGEIESFTTPAATPEPEPTDEPAEAETATE